MYILGALQRIIDDLKRMVVMVIPVLIVSSLEAEQPKRRVALDGQRDGYRDVRQVGC